MQKITEKLLARSAENFLTRGSQAAQVEQGV